MSFITNPYLTHLGISYLSAQINSEFSPEIPKEQKFLIDAANDATKRLSLLLHDFHLGYADFFSATGISTVTNATIIADHRLRRMLPDVPVGKDFSVSVSWNQLFKWPKKPDLDPKTDDLLFFTGSQGLLPPVMVKTDDEIASPIIPAYVSEHPFPFIVGNTRIPRPSSIQGLRNQVRKIAYARREPSLEPTRLPQRPFDQYMSNIELRFKAESALRTYKYKVEAAHKAKITVSEYGLNVECVMGLTASRLDHDAHYSFTRSTTAVDVITTHVAHPPQEVFFLAQLLGVSPVPYLIIARDL